MPDTCRIVALGGLGEVGKNMTVYEYDGSIVVVDAGLAFPRDEHLGVDLVLPDFSYLRENADAIKAVILTHGHEDHVGSLPYLMREVPIPEVWATRLTLGLVKSKLDEHGLLRAAELREVHPDDPPRELGPFRISFVRIAHSIPDARPASSDARCARTGTSRATWATWGCRGEGSCARRSWRTSRRTNSSSSAPAARESRSRR